MSFFIRKGGGGGGGAKNSLVGKKRPKAAAGAGGHAKAKKTKRKQVWRASSFFRRSSFFTVIVSWDFDCLFMILSYSLEVRHVPLFILFLNFFYVLFLNFYHYDLFGLSCNPDSGTEFIPNNGRLWDKWRIIHTITLLSILSNVINL
jgi:hypothetical protein